MSSELEMHHVLVLSTRHVSKQTALTINEGELAAFTRPEGWMFNVDVASLGCPHVEIINACKLARVNGCEWVMFDCDGPEVGELPTFDWS